MRELRKRERTREPELSVSLQNVEEASKIGGRQRRDSKSEQMVKKAIAPMKLQLLTILPLCLVLPPLSSPPNSHLRRHIIVSLNRRRLIVLGASRKLASSSSTSSSLVRCFPFPLFLLFEPSSSSSPVSASHSSNSASGEAKQTLLPHPALSSRSI